MIERVPIRTKPLPLFTFRNGKRVGDEEILLDGAVIGEIRVFTSTISHRKSDAAIWIKVDCPPEEQERLGRAWDWMKVAKKFFMIETAEKWINQAQNRSAIQSIIYLE